MPPRSWNSRWTNLVACCSFPIMWVLWLEGTTILILDMRSWNKVTYLAPLQAHPHWDFPWHFPFSCNAGVEFFPFFLFIVFGELLLPLMVNSTFSYINEVSVQIEKKNTCQYQPKPSRSIEEKNNTIKMHRDRATFL